MGEGLQTVTILLEYPLPSLENWSYAVSRIRVIFRGVFVGQGQPSLGVTTYKHKLTGKPAQGSLQSGSCVRRGSLWSFVERTSSQARHVHYFICFLSSACALAPNLP